MVAPLCQRGQDSFRTRVWCRGPKDGSPWTSKQGRPWRRPCRGPWRVAQGAPTGAASPTPRWSSTPSAGASARNASCASSRPQMPGTGRGGSLRARRSHSDSVGRRTPTSPDSFVASSALGSLRRWSMRCSSTSEQGRPGASSAPADQDLRPPRDDDLEAASQGHRVQPSHRDERRDEHRQRTCVSDLQRHAGDSVETRMGISSCDDLDGDCARAAQARPPAPMQRRSDAPGRPPIGVAGSR